MPARRPGSGARSSSPGSMPSPGSPPGSPRRAFSSRSPRGRVEVPEDKMSDPWIRDNLLSQLRPESWVDRWILDQPFGGGLWLHILLGLVVGYILGCFVPVSYEQSALMTAVGKGDEHGSSVVQALLQHGHPSDKFEVQYANLFGVSVPAAVTTPLYVAAQSGSIAIMHELLQHGASPQKGLISLSGLEVLYSETPLYAAARGGHLGALQALKEAGASLGQGRLVLFGLLGGTSPLHTAVQNPSALGDMPEIVKILQGEESCRGHWGLDSQETLLFAAAKGGHRQVVEALLPEISREGSDLRSQGRFLGPAGIFGYVSPLYAAAEAGQTDIVELLLKQKADANGGKYSLFEQASPLYAAAAVGDSKITRALLTASPPASPDVGYAYGVLGLLGHTTPLYAAAEADSLDAVQQLLGTAGEEKKRKWSLLTPANATPSTYASPTDGRWSVGWLHWFRWETALYAAARNGNPAMVEALLGAGAVAAQGMQQFGWGYLRQEAPLYAAALRGHADSVEKLVAVPGLDSNAGQSGALSPVALYDVSVEVWSATPLYAAAKEGHVAIVEHLLGARSAPSEGYAVLENTWHVHPLCAAIRGPATLRQQAHAHGEEGSEDDANAGLTRHIRVAEVLIRSGADFEETQCGLGMYLEVYSAEYLAGDEGKKVGGKAGKEMYDAVSTTVFKIKRDHIYPHERGQAPASGTQASASPLPPPPPGVDEVVI